MADFVVRTTTRTESGLDPNQVVIGPVDFGGEDE